MARTLPNNITDNYLKSTARPRIYVKIADKDGNDKYFYGMAADTIGDNTYGRDLGDAGTITWEIDEFGGVSSTSGVTLSNLELGKDIELGLTDDLDTTGAGRMMSEGSGGENYDDMRSATTGIFGTASIVVGRVYASNEYNVYRGFGQFKLPSDFLTCESAVIELEGKGDHADTEFDIYVLEGTWAVYDNPGMMNDFSGWVAGNNDYTGDVLNETFTSYMFDITAGSRTNKIRLNADGLKIINDAGANGTVKFMILSERDYDYDTGDPTGEEFVTFKSSNVQLKIRYNTEDLDNREATIFLGFDPLPSSPAESDLLQLWTGVVDNYTIDNEKIELKLRQNNFKKSIMIPENTMLKDDFPHLNNDIIGKPIPIIYGDFMGNLLHKEGVAYAEDEQTGNDMYGLGDFVKGYVHSTTDLSAKRIMAILSKHSLKEMDHTAYIYEESLKSFCIIAGDITDASDSNYSKFYISMGTAEKWPYELTRNSEDLYGVAPVICLMPKALHFAENLPSMIQAYNLMKDDTDSYCTFGDVGENGVASYDFPSSYGVQQLFDYKYIVFHVEFIDTPVENTFRFQVFLYLDFPAENKIIDEFINSDGWQWFAINELNLPSDPESAGDIYVAFVALAACTETRIKNVSLSSGFYKNINKEIYMKVKGKKDDASGTITGAANALLENPSHIIESIARDNMELASSEIDTSSFDSTATTLTIWKGAFQLLDRIDTMKLFGIIGKECKSKIYWDYQDRLTIKTFSETEDFPNAGANTGSVPGALDIYDEDATATSGTFTNHPILKNTFRLSKMELSEIKNEFILHYRENYATNESEKTLYIRNNGGTLGSVDASSDIDTNITEANLENDQVLLSTSEQMGLKKLIADSLNANLTNNLWEYNAKTIRDDATANKLIQYYIERLSKRRRRVRFTTKLSALGVELADFINTRHNRVENIFGEAEMQYKKWEVHRLIYDLNRFTIIVEAIEV